MTQAEVDETLKAMHTFHANVPGSEDWITVVSPEKWVIEWTPCKALAMPEPKGY